MFTIFFFFNTLFSQWDFLPMGNSGRFSLGKPAATESRYPPLINYKVHAGSFRVSVIRRTLTWPTGCLTCVRHHLYAFVYARRLGTPTASQHNICELLLCSWKGLNLGSWNPVGLEADHVLPIEPPHVPFHCYIYLCQKSNTIIYTVACRIQNNGNVLCCEKI